MSIDKNALDAALSLIENKNTETSETEIDSVPSEEQEIENADNSDDE